MTTEDQRLTVADFETFIAIPEHAERRLELLDGYIHEKGMTEEVGVMLAFIGSRLYEYAISMGRSSMRGRHHMPYDTYTLLLPDIGFTSYERAVPAGLNGVIPQMPDLVVEVKSPSDTYRMLRHKAEYYLDNGTYMVWLIYPEKQIVEIYSSDADIEILMPSDTIYGADILPGFELPVLDLFSHSLIS